jgi:hypothetical protein
VLYNAKVSVEAGSGEDAVGSRLSASCVRLRSGWPVVAGLASGVRRAKTRSGEAAEGVGARECRIVLGWLISRRMDRDAPLAVDRVVLERAADGGASLI